ncbi:hypothetical protein BV22DRAFT_813800 [Leucogyrophana mollusca]|uniref:Uncharacterized protein n=1 Tax=Leucogyrophana mollusca TaxID=85980 RepID=A0ACB8B4B8_9AGAM|nr:hypothetical protein BV22DRAFT_813800 [Leucogyrophana mollusca]
MAALPSFIELMASLGIDDAKSSTSNKSRARSRSGSSCSSSSSLSGSMRGCSPSFSPSVNLSSDSPVRDTESERRHRHRAVRYSPYISASSSSRLNSVPSLTFSQADEEDTSRSSTSPHPPSPRRVPRRPPSLNFARERPASTPISSYVRRKTPQNSPTATAFPHRVHAERPRTISPPTLMPMSLPTLPPMLVTSN